MQLLTQQQFLQRCKKLAHKNLDFSKAVYINATTKIKLSCKKHPKQVFYMDTRRIYKGTTSCLLCNGRVKNQEQFLQLCKERANPNVDFSKAVYAPSKYIQLSCKKHPEVSFKLRVSAIFRGLTGCKECLGRVVNQQQFLAKCKQYAHVDLDLSQALYKNAKTKVKLSCKKHPDCIFYMAIPLIYRGFNHCPACKIHITTQDEFLAKCKQKAHKNLDFSKAVYQDSKSKVEVSCKVHIQQSFYMLPRQIYQGQSACIFCLGKVTNQETFLAKCKQTASPNVDLSQAVYRKSNVKVKLSCKEHPEQVFYMTPNDIYRGFIGCALCLNKVTNQKQFIDKCRQTAKDTIDLSRAVYKKSNTPVKLSCKKHPEQIFCMIPENIYRGQNACPGCQQDIVEKISIDRSHSQQQFLEKCKTANKNLDLSEAVYRNRKTKVKLSCKLHPKQVFYMFPENIYRGQTGCKSCSTSGTSQKEQDLADFIKSIYKGKIVLNDRTALNGKELDIYLPEKKLAIEFNGVYWHSDINKPTNYHYEKFKSCKAKGIRLIQIWEDTWDSKQDVVKHFLKQELNSLPTVDIKDTTIITGLDEKTVKAFLNTYHLEGFAKYSYVLALKHQSTKELLAVMTFTKTANKGELLLSCFATKTPIVGGFNALIDTAKENCVKGLYRAKNSSKARCFIALTNNETDTGELYKNNGWQQVESLPISYTYWHKSSMRRVLRSRYNKHQFKTSRKLQHLKGLNLKQLEELNSLYRCYDTGIQKWKLILK